MNQTFFDVVSNRGVPRMEYLAEIKIGTAE